MANQVVRVKVRRETIEACITCPLCNKLLRDATTVSECLHTFCRNCIYKKLDDEELECCPICNIDLGGVPLEKLRPDHTLQDVRAKIFPFKRRKVEAPEVAHAVTLPARRKERSLSSLVVSTPKVLVQTTTTGRRTKPIPRKASSLRGPSFPNERLVKKEENPMEDHSESSSSPETLKRFFKNAKQTCSAEHGQSSTIDEPENGTEALDGKSDLWQPLNCLVEVANRTKSFKSNSHASNAKIEHSHVSKDDPQPLSSNFQDEVREATDLLAASFDNPPGFSAPFSSSSIFPSVEMPLQFSKANKGPSANKALLSVSENPVSTALVSTSAMVPASIPPIIHFPEQVVASESLSVMGLSVGSPVIPIFSSSTLTTVSTDRPSFSVPPSSQPLPSLHFVPRPGSKPTSVDGIRLRDPVDMKVELTDDPSHPPQFQLDLRSFMAEGLKSLGFTSPMALDDLPPTLAEILLFPQLPNDMSSRSVVSQFAQLRALMLDNYLRFQFLMDDTEVQFQREDDRRVTECEDLRNKVVEATKISHQAVFEKESFLQQRDEAVRLRIAAEDREKVLESSVLELEGALSSHEEQLTRLRDEKTRLHQEIVQIRQENVQLREESSKFPGHLERGQYAAMQAVIDGFKDTYGEENYDFKKVEAAVDLHLQELDVDTPPLSPQPDPSPEMIATDDNVAEDVATQADSVAVAGANEGEAAWTLEAVGKENEAAGTSAVES